MINKKMPLLLWKQLSPIVSSSRKVSLEWMDYLDMTFCTILS